MNPSPTIIVASNAASGVLPDAACAMPALWTRFLGYLSADGLTYLLGFAIYGWLIRILADAQYGQLSVATSIYQVLMMLGAWGLDLIGPRLIAEAGGDPMRIVQRSQSIRMSVTLGVCGPVTAVLGALYWHRGQAEVAAIIVAGFAMVLARTVDVSYLAVALGMPGALARTRTLGLGLYLAALLLCEPAVVRRVWIVPLLNATGVYLGRAQLLRILRRHAKTRRHAKSMTPSAVSEIKRSHIAWQGAKASSGQLLMLAFQTLDVVLLARYVPAEAVGQYAMVSRLYLFGTAVLTCLLNTFLPELVAAANDRALLPKRFRRFAFASAALGGLGAVVFWLAGPSVCEMLGRRHLAIIRQVAPVYAVVFLVMAVCNPFLSLLPSLHRAGAYVGGIAGTAALLGGMDILLVPRFGALGAAFGQLAATSFLALLAVTVYQRYVRNLNRLGALLPAPGYVS
jgi:O-antigen/teichoic acid export membrane protein